MTCALRYEQALQYLYNTAPLFQQQGPGAYKAGLETTHLLDSHFGHPHRAYATIHIAGTNGKGSCAHTLAAILQSAGYRTGLYTSPHLVDFRERIRVDGQMIPEAEVLSFIEQEKEFFEPLHPSFFEVTTAMAFRFFKKAGVDVAVIETGLGGRLDCTNIITPQLSVITNISLDHTSLLGNTTTQIAAEKAGIIKPSVPCVIGEADELVRPVFEATARKVGAPIFFAEDKPQVLHSTLASDGRRRYTTSSHGTIIGELTANYQIKNTNTLLTALSVMKRQGLFTRITTSHIQQGFASVCRITGLAGRWQLLQRNPTIICDTGHNAGGWAYLSSQLQHMSHRLVEQGGQLHIIFGMAADKDVCNILRLLPPNARFYWTQASVRRALPAEDLQAFARQAGLKGAAFENIPTALNAALDGAKSQDAIFVGGSSFVVADLLAALKNNN